MESIQNKNTQDIEQNTNEGKSVGMANREKDDTN